MSEITQANTITARINNAIELSIPMKMIHRPNEKNCNPKIESKAFDVFSATKLLLFTHEDKNNMPNIPQKAFR